MSTGKRVAVSILVLAAMAAIAIGAAAAGLVSERPSVHRPVVATSVGGPVFSLQNAAIGSATTRSVTVSNTGTAAGLFTLTAASEGTLADAVRISVTATDGARVAARYAGSLVGLCALPLGTLRPGEHVVVRFRVTLASTGSPAHDESLAGGRAAATLSWTATQV